MSQSAGRYERSMTGMIGALLVTIGLIAAFVVFRAVNRDELEIEPQSVDYLATVRSLQQGGMPWVAYPPALPDGWKATRVDLNQDDDVTWALSLLTEDDRYVGVRQWTGSVDALVEEVVDERADEGKPVQLESALAPTWRTFTDRGGDYAVVTTYGETVLLVVGTGDEQDVRDFAASLVVTPVA